jgi:Glyoxalase-like domain
MEGPTPFQVVIDCADPDRMARFWAVALRYDLEEPPGDFASWKEYWMSVGVPEEEAGDGYDSIVDPSGTGPRIWFQQVPEAKSVKNRLHFDLRVGGGRSSPIETRMERVIAEADRLIEAGATERLRMHTPEHDHFFIGMADPEGNEFDVV